MQARLIATIDGEYITLDTIKNEPIRLTMSFEDIADTAVTSNYSQTFRLPHTNTNYQFFQTAFDVDGYDFDVTQKVEARIQVNGYDFVKGHMRLLKVFVSNDSLIEYECVFFGETRDFASKIGNKTLNDLDFSDYDHVLTHANVVTSWAAEPTSNNGLLNGDVIYPLVNFGNTYDENGAPNEPTIQVGGANGFTSSSYPLEAARFKPMIRVNEVFRRIMAEAEFDYDSNFLESELVRKMYVSAWGNEASIETDGASSNLFRATVTNNNLDVFDSGTIPFPTESYDYNDNYSLTTYKYTAPIDGQYVFRTLVDFILVSPSGIDSDITVRLRRNNITVDSQSYQGFAGGPYFDVYDSGEQAMTLVAGDEVYVDLVAVDPIDNFIPKAGSYFKTNTAAGQVSLSNMLDDKYKQVDFIKDIVKLFHLVIVPHPWDFDRFVIEPFEDFVNARYHENDTTYNRIWDITDKVDVGTDVVIEPTFYTQKQSIDFTYSEDNDWLNKLNKDEFKEVYGALTLRSDNELLSGTREVSVGLAPTPVTQLDNNFPTNAGMGNTIIPHVITKEANDTGVQNKPVRAKTRLLFYNGYKDCGVNDPTNLSVWWFNDDTSTPVSYDYYPRVSPFQNFPISSSSLDLNWQREVGYSLYPIATGNDVDAGLSVYDQYWANYIDSLYDKWARKLTVTAILSPADLTYPNFYWDKIVRFKNTYFRLDKIENFNVGERDKCKLTLIKLETPNIDYATEVPLVWNEWAETPESVTTGWGLL